MSAPSIRVIVNEYIKIENRVKRVGGEYAFSSASTSFNHSIIYSDFDKKSKIEKFARFIYKQDKVLALDMVLILNGIHKFYAYKVDNKQLRDSLNSDYLRSFSFIDERIFKTKQNCKNVTFVVVVTDVGFDIKIY